MMAIVNKFSNGISSIRLYNDENRSRLAWVKLYNPSLDERQRGCLLLLPHRYERSRLFILNEIRKQRQEVLFHGKNQWSILYSFGPWVPYGANRSQLPFEIERREGKIPILHSPERGLKDLNKEISRLKSFTMREAIKYSYFKDLRFIVLLCAILGYTLWSYIVPEPLLLKTEALNSPDLKLLVQVAKDTYITNNCSTHTNVVSPCSCGEPLNNAVRHLCEESYFDPLQLNYSRLKSFSVFVASILLTIALAESVSHSGLYIDIHEHISNRDLFTKTN